MGGCPSLGGDIVSTDENTERCPAPCTMHGVIHPSANIRVNTDTAITVDSWGAYVN